MKRRCSRKAALLFFVEGVYSLRLMICRPSRADEMHGGAVVIYTPGGVI